MKKFIAFLRRIFPSFFFKEKEDIIFPCINNLHLWLQIEKETLFLINEYREELGKEKVIPCEKIRISAKARVRYMEKHDKLSHAGKNIEFQILEKLGVKYPAEIIEAQHLNAVDIVTAWKNSPDHNTAMIEGGYKYVGISRIKSNKGKFFVCCIFGK